MPATFTAGSTNSRTNAYTKSSIKNSMDVEVLSQYFNVVTDTIGDPTGTAPDGTAEHQASDIIPASAEDIAKCDLLLVKMIGPYTSGAVDENYVQETDEEYGMYTPASLQYGEYTASGARNPSLGGEMITTTFNDGYTMQTATRKQNLSYWNKTAGKASNYSDLEMLQRVAGLKTDAPVVVIMTANRSGAMVWSEVEPLADTILYAYGSATDAAIVQILAGEVEPSALLVHQQPASMQTVEKEFEDVPRDLECYTDADGNVYDFAYGLNWSGKIDDERVKTYSAAPLTECQNIDFKYANQ